MEALRVALEESKREQQRQRPKPLPPAPTFTPTEAEFADPIAYIESICPLACDYGICKIVPPVGWAPPCGLKPEAAQRQYPTRRQRLHDLLEGKPYDDGEWYTLSEYKAMADAFRLKHFPDLGASAPSAQEQAAAARAAGQEPPMHQPFGASRPIPGPTPAQLEASKLENFYWDAVETGRGDLEVEYGNDQDVRAFGSGFEKLADPRAVPPPSSVPVDFSRREYYQQCGWNTNNLPFLPRCPVRMLEGEVAGVNVPWLYLGMCLATFCWHVEDNHFFSINYMHHGGAKTWYSVPQVDANAMEKVISKRVYKLAEEQPDFLTQMVLMVPPAALVEAGVRCCSIVQEPGDIIITMPRGYHAGFSHSFNIAEACNFACPSWLPFGRRAVALYKRIGRPSCVSVDQIVVDMARNHKDFAQVDCQIMAADLKAVVERERRGRSSFLRLPGVQPSQQLRMPAGQPRYDCIKTQQVCYLSAVVCNSPKCCEEAQAARAAAAAQQAEERAEAVAHGHDPELITVEPDHAVASPENAEHLCDCEHNHKLLVYWYSLEELEALQAVVQAHADGRPPPPQAAASAPAPVPAPAPALAAAAPALAAAAPAATAAAATAAATAAAPAAGAGVGAAKVDQLSPATAAAAEGAASPGRGAHSGSPGAPPPRAAGKRSRASWEAACRPAEPA